MKLSFLSSIFLCGALVCSTSIKSMPTVESLLAMLQGKVKTLTKQIIPAKKSDKKVVIFDLGDVLFTTSKAVYKSTVLKNASIMSLIGMNLKKELFNMLSSVPAKTDPDNDAIYYEGKKLPQIMVDWQTGRPAKDVLEVVHEHIKNGEYKDNMKALFTSVTSLMFIPKRFSKTQKTINENVNLVKALKLRGYKLYILSNWNKESFPLMKKEHEELLSLFDGAIISGDVGMCKPNKKIYDHTAKVIKKETGFSKKECIFIDDELHNTTAARDAGITALTYTTPGALHKKLQKVGIAQSKKDSKSSAKTKAIKTK